MSYWIAADYFKTGFWSEEQVQLFASVANGTRVASVSESGEHRGPYIRDSIAKAYQNEFQSERPEQCSSAFMDTVLDMLEDSCEDVGKVSCMFSQSLERGQDPRFVKKIQEATLAHFDRRKIHERRFLASFFNINNHWYWYVIDNIEKVCYTGDSFNQLAFLHEAQQQVIPQPLLASILRSYRDVWKYFTGQVAEFKTRAVQCPSQMERDSWSCGQLACASVISFIMRIHYEKLPQYRFAQPITNYDAKDAQFIKERLVMSFAHGDFKQVLTTVRFDYSSKPTRRDGDSPDVVSANNISCYKMELEDLPLPVPVAGDFLSSLEKFWNDPNVTAKPTNPSYNDWVKNPKDYLEKISPNYFAKSREVLRTKVFIQCGCNPHWLFRDQKELLVASVALHSNVKKKGNNSKTSVPLVNSPDFHIYNLPAIKENVIAFAAVKWLEQHGVLLDNQVWRTELKTLRGHSPRTERPLSKSKGVFKVTEYGFDHFLKSTSSTDPGPCIFIEVQNCKGRKKKSDTEKLKTRVEQRRLASTPYNQPVRDKPWIDIVKGAYATTHCPHTPKTVHAFLKQTQPVLNASLSQVRQGLISGKSSAVKRAAVFFDFEVQNGKSSITYGSLLTNYRYREMIPENATKDENGNPCIIWKNFVDQCDMTGCLAITPENYRRVFSIESVRLYTITKIYCGTLIEIEFARDNTVDSNSMMRFINKTIDTQLVNFENHIHFGLPVLRACRDINPGEFIYQMEFDYIGDPLEML